MRQPEIALASIVHALGIELWYRRLRGESCLGIRATSTALKIAGKVMEALDAERALWGERLPGDAADFFGWCLWAGPGHASCASRLLNGPYRGRGADEAIETRMRETRAGKPACRRPQARHRAVVQPDRREFVPQDWPQGDPHPCRRGEGGTRKGPGLEKLNKTDLAARAALIVEGTGWLPAPLRIAGNDNLAEARLQAAE